MLNLIGRSTLHRENSAPGKFLSGKTWGIEKFRSNSGDCISIPSVNSNYVSVKSGLHQIKLLGQEVSLSVEHVGNESDL